MPKAPTLTKAHLKSFHDGIRAELRQTAKEIITDQRQSLQPIRKELGEISTKLEAIMSGDVLVTRGQLLRLLEKLRAQGFKVDEREIFTA